MLFENRASQNGLNPLTSMAEKRGTHVVAQCAHDENGSPLALCHHTAKPMAVPYIAATPANAPTSQMPAPSMHMQILAIDSDSSALDASVGILKKLGYERIQTASDGSYGLGLMAAVEQ